MANGEQIKALLDGLAERAEAGDVSGCVAVCEQILELLEKGAIPDLWASIQGILADNLRYDPQQGANGPERAIHHYELALDVLTEEGSPQSWAGNHGNLATLYLDRGVGDRAQNLASAIEHFSAALRVFNQEPGTVDWAATHASLGEAYAELGGHPADVIEHSEAALTVFTPGNKPSTWLKAKIALADAYATQGPEGKAHAAAHLEEAAPRFPDQHRMQRGLLFEKLGHYVGESNLGDTAEGMERAIRAFEAALSEYQVGGIEDGLKRAHAQLGNGYRYRVMGDRADNIGTAIEHLEALLGRTAEDEPGWAEVNAALGILYDDPALQ